MKIDSEGPFTVQAVGFLVNQFNFVNIYIYEPIPSHEVENNFVFLVNFYATFAGDGVPPMSHFQATNHIRSCDGCWCVRLIYLSVKWVNVNIHFFFLLWGFV